MSDPFPQLMAMIRNPISERRRFISRAAEIILFGASLTGFLWSIILLTTAASAWIR